MDGLTVAVTGPTGTLGHGLLPLLERDDRVTRLVGIARRPFDPAERGWSKMHYRRGDVRDAVALADACEGADVVVHLAFSVTGSRRDPAVRAGNVDGTRNAFRAAVAAGAARFVYTSSVAAYGFHADNPAPMREDWPTRPARSLSYAQEKAELEQALHDDARAHPAIATYVLRPPFVLGPHAIGGKRLGPPPIQSFAMFTLGLLVRSPVHPPVLMPDEPVQLVHEEDVGHALVQCIVGAGPSGAYNIAADDVLRGADVARALGLAPLPVPAGIVRRCARIAARAPVPSGLEWAEALAHPPLVDTSKAKTELGWQPRWSAADTLRQTVAALTGAAPAPEACAPHTSDG